MKIEAREGVRFSNDMVIGDVYKSTTSGMVILFLGGLQAIDLQSGERLTNTSFSPTIEFIHYPNATLVLEP